MDIQTYEKHQKFFAEKSVSIKKRIKNPYKSPIKKEKSASILRASIENIELERLESDFPG